MIIALSDLHLGSPQANKVGIQTFIREFLQPNQADISHLVLLGDILDLWRNTNSRVLAENADVITALGQLEMKKTYIIGNHDYAILNLLSDRRTDTSIPSDNAGALDHVVESLELTQDGVIFKFIHGHQIDYWSMLQFYRVFCQAMCFVNINDQYLYNVWNIVNQFSSELPTRIQAKLNSLSRETEIDLEHLLAGPLNGNMQGEKHGLLYEWELLESVRDLGILSVSKTLMPHIQEQLEELSSFLKREHKELGPLSDKVTKTKAFIHDFANLWKAIMTLVDTYPSQAEIPEVTANPLHICRRIAATLTTGLGSNDFLIRGHGHSPYVSQSAKVADAGCWIGSKGSYIKIDDGHVSVHKW
ncbi:MAG: hypothetical protein ACXAAO_02535 [Candidatus Thorarchaeota archaeon]